jgi:hypothetical protein
MPQSGRESSGGLGKRRTRAKVCVCFAGGLSLTYRRFLYTVFWAIDACFRLKRKKISSWLADPSIQDGWLYFVRWAGFYSEFVKTLGEQKKVCSSVYMSCSLAEHRDR